MSTCLERWGQHSQETVQVIRHPLFVHGDGLGARLANGKGS